MSKLALLIEDDAPIRLTMSMAFRVSGLRFEAVSDGEEAVRFLSGAAELPAVIFLDLRMPRMDGQAFREHQLSDPRLKDIPTVLLSADSSLEQKATTLGVSHFLHKPFALEELLRLANQYCCSGS